MMDGNAEPLTERQERIVRRLAKGFARRGLYRQSLDAEDYFQAGYLRVWEARLRGEATDDKMVYVVARQAMVMQDREAFRAKRSYAAETENPRRQDFASQAGEADAIDIEDALGRLTDRQRFALIATYWLGMTAAEAAAAAGRSKPLFHLDVRDGKAAIKDLIGDDFGEWARRRPARHAKTIYKDRKYKRKPVDRRAYQAAWRAKRKAEKANVP